MAMYVRVKREKSTYFITCDTSDNIVEIKKKVSQLIDCQPDEQKLILMPGGEVLDDLKTLEMQKVKNDDIVALTFKTNDDQFEEVNIVSPIMQLNSRDSCFRGASISPGQLLLRVGKENPSSPPPATKLFED